MNNSIEKYKYCGHIKLPTNCYIMGPTGPTGPAATLPTISSILVGNDGTQSVASEAEIDLGTLVNSTGTAFTYTAPYEITITENGTYFLNISSIINNTNVSGDLGISLEINGVIVPTASEYIATQTAAFSSELQHSYTASAGDVITLVNNSSISNDYHDITVAIFKIV